MVPSDSDGDDRSENAFFGEFVVGCLELKVASRCTHELASARDELNDDSSGGRRPGRRSMAACEEARSSHWFRELGFLFLRTDRRWISLGAPVEVETGLKKLLA